MFLEASPVSLCVIQLALGSGISLVWSVFGILSGELFTCLPKKLKQHFLLGKDFRLWLIGDWPLGVQPGCWHHAFWSHSLRSLGRSPSQYLCDPVPGAKPIDSSPSTWHYFLPHESAVWPEVLEDRFKKGGGRAARIWEAKWRKPQWP